MDLVVTHCGFHRFHTEHGEPLRTLIHSEWDRTVMDAMNASPRAIRVQRPETISTGCDRRTGQVMGVATTQRAPGRPPEPWTGIVPSGQRIVAHDPHRLT